MDTADLVVLPRAYDPADTDLREVDLGAAVRVRLVGLSTAAQIAPVALAHAQQAGVGFHVDGTGTTTRLTIGPVD